MFLRKVLFLTLGLLFTVSNALYAVENDRHLRKKNALSIKLGGIFFQESDFTDYWKIDAQNLSNFAWEFAYERKISSHIGIEFTLGSYSSDEASKNTLIFGDSFVVDIKNVYFSPTLKGHFPLNNSFVFYGGAGPDFCYTEVDCTYIIGAATNHSSDEFFALGVHGLAGIEYYFIKRPARTSYPDMVFDAPVSLFLEYKYSWVEIGDADKDLFLGLGSAHDLQIGGHLVFVGLRWHY